MTWTFVAQLSVLMAVASFLVILVYSAFRGPNK